MICVILFACKYAQEALVHNLIRSTFVECAQSWYHRMLVNIHCRSFYIMSFKSEYSRCTDAILRCWADISGIMLLCTTYSFFLSKVSTQSFLSYIYIYTVESINNDNCNNKNTVVMRHFSIPFFILLNL